MHEFVTRVAARKRIYVSMDYEDARRVTGCCRSDEAKVKWTNLEVAADIVVQKKPARRVDPMHPALSEAIESAPRVNEYVLNTQYGTPFSPKGARDEYARVDC